jgi:hypothetical protein
MGASASKELTLLQGGVKRTSALTLVMGMRERPAPDRAAPMHWSRCLRGELVYRSTVSVLSYDGSIIATGGWKHFTTRHAKIFLLLNA